jgi:hypothetical protein
MLKEVLNMIIIVSTLLFGVAVAVLFGFSHNDYTFTVYDYATPVIQLVAEATMAMSFLFATLITSIILYVSLAIASFRDVEDKINVRMFSASPSVARFALALDLMMLVYGICWAYDFKFPAWGCINKMTEDCLLGSPPALSPRFLKALFSGTIAPGAAVSSFGDKLIEVTAGVTIAIAGVALSSKTFVHYQSYRAIRQQRT